MLVGLLVTARLLAGRQRAGDDEIGFDCARERNRELDLRAALFIELDGIMPHHATDAIPRSLAVTHEQRGSANAFRRSQFVRHVKRSKRHNRFSEAESVMLAQRRAPRQDVLSSIRD